MVEKCKHFFDRTGKCRRCGEHRENLKLKDSGVDIGLAKEMDKNG